MLSVLVSAANSDHIFHNNYKKYALKSFKTVLASLLFASVAAPTSVTSPYSIFVVFGDSASHASLGFRHRWSEALSLTGNYLYRSGDENDQQVLNVALSWGF